MWLKKEIHLKPRSRGFHLITDELLRELPELRKFKVGMMKIFLMHTSASLTINENADSRVRQDFESYFNSAVPKNAPYYLHRDEGPDDLPAHIKTSLLGSSLNIPITDGSPRMGIWQGIFLCEHRNLAGSRCVVVTERIEFLTQ
jgi:secondary thiamine-phosphate synthase enzyme